MSAESALLAAFAAQLGPIRTRGYQAVPWRSATFSGVRHFFRIETDAVADIDAFTRNIAETEIVIPCGFVADITAICQISENVRQIDIEALTINA